MTASRIILSEPIIDYMLSAMPPEPPVFAALRAQTQKMSTAKMQICIEQGRFLALLAKLITARRTLDIGVFTGYSAMAVADVLPDDGVLIACDRNIEWTKIAKRFWMQAGLSQKIDLRLGDAGDTLRQLLDSGEAENFDFAFIDADKLEYDNYYELSLQLVKPGGLIVIDNVLCGGDVADDSLESAKLSVMRQLNQKIAHDERVEMCMLPIGDGMSLVRKKLLSL